MHGRMITLRPTTRWLFALGLALAGSACTTVLAPERTPAIGPPFNEALKERYLALGSSKWQQGSWEILHFRDKARSAMLGDLVLPDRVTWVPSGLQGELVEGRERLLLFLDAGGKPTAIASNSVREIPSVFDDDTKKPAVFNNSETSFLSPRNSM